MSSTVIVLGASGNLGRALVRAFYHAGWGVVAQARQAAPADLIAGVQWDRTCISDREYWSSRHAGTAVVVHAINQDYTHWTVEAEPALRCALDIAGALDARLMFPGNIYGYGFPIPSLISEDMPQYPTTRKGRLRQRLETLLTDAAARGVRSIVLRAGDFIGGETGGGWFERVLVADMHRGVLRYPGPLDRLHAWQDVDTFARCFVSVAERERALPRFQTFHIPGHQVTGTQLLDEIERSAFRLGLLEGRPPRVASMPWALMVACQPFVQQWRELAEIRALWQQPHALDGRALEAFLGEALPPTLPLARVVQRALLRASESRTANATGQTPRMKGVQP